MKTTSNPLAYAQMTAAMILVGSLFVASKVIVQHVPVFTASFLRQFLAFVVLVGFLWYQKTPRPVMTHKRDYVILLTQSIVGTFLFSLFMLYGLKYTNSIDANIITSTTPLTMMLIAVFLLGESFTKRRGLALALALLGTLSINVLGGHDDTQGNHVWLGNGLIVLAVIAEGVFFGFGKLLSTPIASTWLSCILTALGSAWFLPFALYDLAQTDFITVPWFVWLLVAYTGVGVTALGVVLMNMGMAKVSASSASIFTALMPVSGVALSVLFLHETFYWYHALGMVLVLAAMGLMMFEKFTQEPNASSVHAS